MAQLIQVSATHASAPFLRAFRSRSPKRQTAPGKGARADDQTRKNAGNTTLKIVGPPTLQGCSGPFSGEDSAVLHAIQEASKTRHRLALQDALRLQNSKIPWERPLMNMSPRTAVAVFFTAAFTMSVAAQDFMAKPGTTASAFPKPDRPVADIVSPIWHDERERDEAGEPRQLVRLLGIKPGMTVADSGAGSGYYVVRLAPVVGPNGRVIA